MDPLWILAAFILGFAAYRVGLPPLVGYLIAGFALQSFGVSGGETLDRIADLGVMLLLFTIGLKLKIRSLLRPEIWAGASIHMIITIIIFGSGIFVLSVLGWSGFNALDFKLCILLAFALSFSSTVFAVKVLEDKGEMSSLHGRVSIGVLIMQDIFAVLFLTFSTGKIPSPWAIALIAGLLMIRPLLFAVLSRVGHRELLLLFSVFLALGLGAAGFEFVGLKPDLGALVLGVLVAGHPKTGEMSNILLSFKDLFLVGFFLSIGLSGAPTLQALGIAGFLAIAVAFKIVLFFFLFTRFKLRARTSLLTSFSLANYSEFGLLVGSIGVKNGWIGHEWLTIIAIALSISFILASPLNAAAHSIFDRWAERLRAFQSKTRHPEDQPLDPGDAQIAVFGMGRVGTAAYEEMRARQGDIVIGVDFDADVVKNHQAAGRNVILGDATDIDFWARVRMGRNEKLRLVMLAMSKHAANMQAVKELSVNNFDGIIAATAQFDDQVEELKEAGVQGAFNFYAEAGYGFAEHVCQALDDKGRRQSEPDET
ncbi:Putative glutathione-regulated potassium-efflux system protein KefB [Olavius sp. associated proteobacterium Delta 1]|nr:Putative glutathione-regulated potassium-efflux system protein KefB [Olavius sp. associated proteobacterium Delta 1]